jgi:signal transduction histidine kinase
VTRRPPPAAVAAIALAAVAAAGVMFALALTSDHVRAPAVQASLLALILLSYAFSGLVAWWRRPASPFGPLMVAAGFGAFLTSLSFSNAALVFTIGQAFDLLPAVLFLHVFLAFPSGRLERRLERVLVVAGYLIAFSLELLGMLLGGFGPDNLLEVVAAPEVAWRLMQVQLIALSAICLAGIGVLVARRRGSTRPQRRSITLLIDAFALGLVMIAALFTSGALQAPLPAFETIRRVTFVVIALAPIAFLIGLLDARLARSAVGDLVMDLRRNPAPGELRDALARALRDPSLRLAYWLEEFDTYADPEGNPVSVSDEEGRFSTTLIDREDAHVGALLHDPSLLDEPELLEAVVAAGAMALENARLHVELRAHLDELKASRRRIIEAAQSERRRMERNLHDGAQQRLVSLSLELGLLELRFAEDPEARRQVEQVKQELGQSLEELRELARGLHPAVLTGHGLGPALESLVARSPLPVGLQVRLDTRLPEEHEEAAYYLVSESLTNVARYADASAVSVDVARSDGRLIVEIADDGCGGANTTGGSGLRGLADRVEALDGRLRVYSPEGGGTRVRADIPCA